MTLPRLDEKRVGGLVIVKRKAERILPNKDWDRVRELFDRCVELPPEDRDRFLAQQTQESAELREEVISLLQQLEESDSFFKSPFPSLLPPPTKTPLVEASSHLAASEPPAQQLGKYLLFHRLGQGGMAEVYLAKITGQLSLGRLVAVKKILPHLANNTQFLKQFEYEAKLSSQLSHANIVHTYDFGSFDGAYLLIMEFVNGENLASILATIIDRKDKNKLAIPLDCILYIVAKIADGLDYAHQRKDDMTGAPLNIIHRDISPKNIILSFNGDIKIADFGIAKAKDRAKYTDTGLMRGTLGYLSPEMVRGKVIDSRSDIFSTCSILYELIAGEPLLEGDDLISLIQQTQDASKIGNKIDALPIHSSLKGILHQGLAQSPDERYRTAGQLRDDIDAYLKDHSPIGLKSHLQEFLKQLYPDKIRSRQQIIQNSEQFLLPNQAKKRASKPLNQLKRWKYSMILIAAALLISPTLYFIQKPETQRNDATLNSRPKNSPPQSEQCETDAQRLCPQMKWGAGLAVCLQQKLSQLSENCLKVIQPIQLPKNR